MLTVFLFFITVMASGPDSRNEQGICKGTCRDVSTAKNKILRGRLRYTPTCSTDKDYRVTGRFQPWENPRY